MNKKFFLLVSLTLVILSARSENQELNPVGAVEDASPFVRYMIRSDWEKHKELSEAEENLIIRQKPICISLGADCIPVFQLQSFGLRYMAYPFDWNVISIDTLDQIITRDFDQLLEEKFIHFESSGQIWNTLYGGGFDASSKYLSPGFTFVHVCPDTATKDNFFQLYWPSLKKKMQRRINRFYKALAAGKHVYFLRTIWRRYVKRSDGTSVAHLVKTIEQKFPTLKFTLIAVFADEKECMKNTGIAHVKNFFVLPKDLKWGGDARFKKIFTQLGLLPR